LYNHHDDEEEEEEEEAEEDAKVWIFVFLTSQLLRKS
jgi:hypothetical protein